MTVMQIRKTVAKKVPVPLFFFGLMRGRDTGLRPVHGCFGDESALIFDRRMHGPEARVTMKSFDNGVDGGTGKRGRGPFFRRKFWGCGSGESAMIFLNRETAVIGPL
jgi:hypothetical protein